MDGKTGIDLRVGIPDHDICRVKIQFNGISELEYSSDIINTGTFLVYENLHNIQFYIKAVKPRTKDTVFFKSNLFFLRVVNDLSAAYVNIITNDGTLSLSWPELDKINTDHYLIERFSGASNYRQEETPDTTSSYDFFAGPAICEFFHRVEQVGEPVLNKLLLTLKGFVLFIPDPAIQVGTVLPIVFDIIADIHRAVRALL